MGCFTRSYSGIGVTTAIIVELAVWLTGTKITVCVTVLVLPLLTEAVTVSVTVRVIQSIQRTVSSCLGRLFPGLH